MRFIGLGLYCIWPPMLTNNTSHIRRQSIQTQNVSCYKWHLTPSFSSSQMVVEMGIFSSYSSYCGPGPQRLGWTETLTIFRPLCIVSLYNYVYNTSTECRYTFWLHQLYLYKGLKHLMRKETHMDCKYTKIKYLNSHHRHSASVPDSSCLSVKQNV